MFSDDTDIIDDFAAKRPILEGGVVVVGFIDDIRLCGDSLKITDVLAGVMSCGQGFCESEGKFSLSVDWQKVCIREVKGFRSFRVTDGD